MTILKTLVPNNQRAQYTHELFGSHFSLNLEPTIYAFASYLSKDYKGGYWNFYSLSNGFYMAPDSDKPFKVSCANGYQGLLSADAFGINCCLYAYSDSDLSDDIYLDHYHWLRDFMLEHEEADELIRSTD